MKLLFDENLSPKLPRLLTTHFPGSAHVRECGLKGQLDEILWEYAQANGFTIVSKDSDFQHRSLLYGHPPKLIWLRIGNCTRDQLLQLIIAHEQEITRTTWILSSRCSSWLDGERQNLNAAMKSPRHVAGTKSRQQSR